MQHFIVCGHLPVPLSGEQAPLDRTERNALGVLCSKD